MTAAELRTAFLDRFERPAETVIRAPGRVNLIGEHTDTSDGFVLPMAIDREVRIALAPRDDGIAHIVALDLDDDDRFEVAAPHRKDGWAAYAHGVAWALSEVGHRLAGFDAVFAGDVPRGAGLSSSAALELALARAFAEASGLSWDPPAMAVLCRRAENAWVGVASGIMDQLIGACGEAGSALLLDCRDLSRETVPLPAEARVVILDTGTRRGLVGSAYNERRAQVDAAAQAFGVDVLRDVDRQTLRERGNELDPVVLKRARHVVNENARVLEAVDAMRRGDAAELGRLMDASHVSLRDDFEVSGPALDTMVEVARAHAGCHGARMTGAGFAGCCVALVDEASLDDFVATVDADYRQRTEHEPSLYPVTASAGAGILHQ